eukprot:TRINITY_DN16197_c0_g1_i1.p1 TRINITY_DN16197_c0_g1~~TRINITY_DN16197_c0_g1_i1.p1  ORF type:complete len:109 (-),score=19.41 TRINITY_DN16197_c0_g1_i1:37-363(-)
MNWRCMPKSEKDMNNNNTIGKGEDSLNKEREQFEKEKAVFEVNLHKVQTSYSLEPIQLNIGGKKFSTTLDTLTRYKGSFFSVMFEGNIPLKPCKDGSFFIDRDGTNIH